MEQHAMPQGQMEGNTSSRGEGAPSSQDSLCALPALELHPLYAPLEEGRATVLVLPDSLQRYCPEPAPGPTELFAGRVVASPLPKRHYPLRPVDTAAEGIALGVLLLMTALTVTIRLRYWTQYVDYISFLWNPRSLRRIEEGASGRLATFNSLCDLLYILSSSYVLWRAWLLFEGKGRVGSPLLLLYITLGIGAYYALRLIALHMGPALIREKEAGAVIWRQEQYARRIMWFVLLLFDTTSTYSKGIGMEASIWVGLILVLGTAAYTWIRMGVTFIHKSYRPFYFFLYLCALELLPIVCCLRWLSII